MRSLQCIGVIALNTVRESIRNKILYALLFFAILLIGSGVLVSSLSYVESERILQDIGLGAIRLFGVAIAIFVGIHLIHRDVDRRTVYTILSKPITRAAFLLGKVLGLSLTIWLQTGIMALAFVGVSLATGAPLGASHAAFLLLVAVELAVVVAIAALFSAFTTPMLAAFFTTGTWVVGQLTRDLRDIGAGSESPGLKAATALLHRILPDMESFNLSIEAAHGLPVTSADVVLPVLYGLGWVVILLLGAVGVFERRDFR